MTNWLAFQSCRAEMKCALYLGQGPVDKSHYHSPFTPKREKLHLRQNIMVSNGKVKWLIAW